MGNGIIIDYKRKLLQGSHNNLTKYKQMVIYMVAHGKASYHLPQSQQEFSGSLIQLTN
jgi:hypothetical protein